MERKTAAPAARIRAVLFDFDGTLTKPDAIDYAVIRRIIGCPSGVAMLEFIQEIPSAAEREEAWRKLNEYEAMAARASVPNADAEETVLALRGGGLRLGILSRNSTVSIHSAIRNFTRISLADFSVVLSRDHPVRPKPHPDGVHDAARLFRVKPAELLMVGDFLYDIAAGHAAGAATAFITNGKAVPPTDPAPDFVIARLSELPALLGF
jgi:hydrogenase expression/formation protein HypE